MSMTLSGNGSVGGLAPGGLPNAVVQQQNVAAGVDGNGPAFSAYRSTVQAIPNITWTKITADTEEFDTANCFDNVNSRFQPTVPGYYQVTASAAWVASSVGGVITSIFKNGGEFKRGNTCLNNTSVAVQSGVSALIYMNGTTDYLEMNVYQSSGGSLNAAQGASSTYFQAHLARAA